MKVQSRVYIFDAPAPSYVQTSAVLDAVVGDGVMGATWEHDLIVVQVAPDGPTPESVEDRIASVIGERLTARAYDLPPPAGRTLRVVLRDNGQEGPVSVEVDADLWAAMTSQVRAGRDATRAENDALCVLYTNADFDPETVFGEVVSVEEVFEDAKPWDGRAAHALTPALWSETEEMVEVRVTALARVPGDTVPVKVCFPGTDSAEVTFRVPARLAPDTQEGWDRIADSPAVPETVRHWARMCGCRVEVIRPVPDPKSAEQIAQEAFPDWTLGPEADRTPEAPRPTAQYATPDPQDLTIDYGNGLKYVIRRKPADFVEMVSPEGRRTVIVVSDGEVVAVQA